MKYYTYCNVVGNNILYRGHENGRKVLEKIPFKPTLYIPSNKESDWHSLYENAPLEPIKFGSIKEARDFQEQYKDVQGFPIHGFPRWQYQYITENFPGEIEYDLSKVSILILDIEVISETGGFPDIQKADAPVVMISMYNNIDNSTIVLGLKDYMPSSSDNFEYKKFDTEKELLLYFIQYNKIKLPDVWSGWNDSHFDTPYLINRIMGLFGESTAKQLSPFGILKEKIIEIRGKQVQTYDIYGIVELDYLELYKKFTYSTKESYALGFIAQEELGKTKVELPGDSFKDSYDSHFKTFVQYNAVDTLLVKELDDKMKLIELVFSMAYQCKCNLVDVYKTVLPWEVYIYNYLSNSKIAVPPRTSKPDMEYPGAWVKEPKPGMYGWCMSFDFSGLYPSIIRQWNISPETFYPSVTDTTVDDWVANNEKAAHSTSIAVENNCSVAANGTMYRRNKQGFLPALMEFCMEERKIAKSEMLKLEEEHQRTKNKALSPRISALTNKQMALKILANSAYGAIGNSGFHYYDSRMAEAITLTGQLSDIHLMNLMNARFNILNSAHGVDYVFYGDTDSIYVNCQSLVDKFCPNGKETSKIVRFLNKLGETECQKVIQASIDELFVRTNGFEKVMQNKREAIASKGLFRAKKNYALYVHDSEGVAYDPPKLKVMGIEIVRSSTPKWCRKKLKEGLQMIFEVDEAKFQTWFKDIKDEFMSLPPDEMAFPRGISDIDKWYARDRIYKGGTPIAVRGALLFNHYTNGKKEPIQNGDKVKFLYLTLPNPIKENIISFPTNSTLPEMLKLEKYVDKDTQFEKTFASPLMSLTTIAKWNCEPVSSLEEFFGE